MGQPSGGRVSRLNIALRSLRLRRRSGGPAIAASPADLSIDAQSDCNLLQKVPPEIRDMIYGILYADALIHIVDTGSRLAHVRCHSQLEERRWNGHRHGVDSENGKTFLDARTDENDQLLGLALTCKMLHSEVILRIYSMPQYSIHQQLILLHPPDSVKQISRLDVEINFYRLPQVAIDSIDLDLPTWKKICSSLASMPNLRDLDITIHETYFFLQVRGVTLPATFIAGVLQPLKQIRIESRAGNYNVRIDWALTQQEKDLLGNLPFHLEQIDKPKHSYGLPLRDILF